MPLCRTSQLSWVKYLIFFWYGLQSQTGAQRTALPLILRVIMRLSFKVQVDFLIFKIGLYYGHCKDVSKCVYAHRSLLKTVVIVPSRERTWVPSSYPGWKTDLLCMVYSFILLEHCTITCITL